MSKDELKEAELDGVAGGTSIDDAANTSRTTRIPKPSVDPKAGAEVGLAGLGEGFDGTYYVENVTHKQDGDGQGTGFDTGR